MSRVRILNIVVLGTALAGAVQAQVTLDGTLGPSGPLSGPNYAITADLGQQVGGNLFHSFGLFSIQTGESATFSGPSSVSNIIGRVTGGQVSFIDGALRSTIPGANLYLLNPAGVLFGEHASLDVPGSVHVSTADYLKLGDGGRFDARTPGNSVLTVAPVEAFGFLGDTPGKIAINGSFLQVPEGQTLSLIGGDISLTDATVYAPAGRINIAAVGSAGEVIPTETDVIMQGFSDLATFTLEDQGIPWDVALPLANLDVSGAGGGAVFIRGENWISRGGQVFADTYGDQAGQGIDVALEGTARLEGVPNTLAFYGGFLLTADTIGSGNAGSIQLKVGRLELGNHAGIHSNTYGPGRGSDITIAASLIEMKNGASIAASTFSSARSGDITITADTMTMLDMSKDDSSAALVTESGIDPDQPGDSGSITLNVGRLDMIGKALITSAAYGMARGGDITINARDAVTITTTLEDLINQPNSGTIRSFVDDGRAGSITLDVGRLELHQGGIFADTAGAGRGGDITITARDAIFIYPYSFVTVAAFDPSDEGNSFGGNAGNIVLTAPHLTLANSSIIDATSHQPSQTSGGNIVVNVAYLKLLDDSEISTSVFGGPNTQGGNINFNSTNIVALNGSAITAQANQGLGGNIKVNAEVFLHDAPSVDQVLNASSQVIGNDGTVQLNAPTTDISGSLVALDPAYLDAAGQLSPRCGTGDLETRSRFIIQGRGALPLDPNDTAPAPVSRCGSERLGLASTAGERAPGNVQPPASVAELPVPSAFGFSNR
ncbi:MAG: filamentous hemagglutinin N-terminal domain-containing protein [Gammaproteobacteria bacterium]|nr:filamentous hemagglutinin N-terminal domain-containing protein [Gammaproteobacteria bacterium]MCP5196862.1 filamentous hemagglutinin N-terminal domain-containing protein [Gammaproteobacteria bacterium]